MRPLLAGICLLAGCAGPGAPVAYESPETTPYDHRPLLKEQYLRAYRAAWNRQVSEVTEEWLEQKLKGEEAGPIGSYVTCCEATPNVTTGWYRGMDAGNKFIARIAAKSELPAAVMEKFRLLKKEIEDHPITDWYISDAYTPSLLVEVPEQQGTVIRTYRDDTRTKLYQVRQVRDGKNHGGCETYDVNGALREVETWVDGVLEGRTIHYSDTGESVGWTTWRNGQRHGPAVSFLWGLPSTYDRWESGRKQGRCLVYLPGAARVDTYAADEKTSTTVISMDELLEEERPATLQRIRETYRR